MTNTTLCSHCGEIIDATKCVTHGIHHFCCVDHLIVYVKPHQLQPDLRGYETQAHNNNGDDAQKVSAHAVHP